MGRTSLRDRVMIKTLAEAGLTDRQIAEEVGWRVRTVRKWRRRGQRAGVSGLSPAIGRPTSGALGSFPASIRETLLGWRRAHPGWGPLTLQTELAIHPAFAGQHVPGVASIGRLLKGAGLTRRYEHHQDLPQPQPPTIREAHVEWEMDALGYSHVPDVGVITLINLNDVASKVKLLSYPCWLGDKRAIRHPTTEDYQLVLRLAFSEWGLPDRLAVDHESVYYDNRSKSPFPTRLHLWLVALDVALTFGRLGQPTDQATTERSHQTWYQQVLLGQRFADWQALREALRQRCDFLNRYLPCATVGDRPPLVACPEAQRPRRAYRPESEEQLLELDRVYRYLAQGCWYRLASNIGAVSLGQQVYVLGRAWARRDVKIQFDPGDQHLVFQAPDANLARRLPLRGVSAQTLLGEQAPLAQLDGYQLALPFAWSGWRMIQGCEARREPVINLASNPSPVPV